MKKSFLLFNFLMLFSLISFSQEYKWYKGNTHTHTVNSDGDELPRRVVRWYLDNNYNFLVISDHNLVTNIKYLDTDKNDDFILISGEEVTDYCNKKPVHVNGLNLKTKIDPQRGNTITETLQNDIDAIRKAGGVPQVNHPAWKRAFNEVEISELKNVKLFEVYNYNKESNNFAAGGFPGMEDIWDKILSKGFLIYGVASDDTHNYLGEFNPSKSVPGKAWVMVKSKELTPEAIMEAMEKGDFYSSIGIILKDVKITDKDYSIEIVPDRDADIKYSTFFIGKDGKILKEDYSLNPSYNFKGDEGYVRARVVCSSGDFAITQPVLIKK